MNKKYYVIPALLVAIGGGAVLAQSDLFVKAENNPSITAQQAKDIAIKEINGTIVEFEYDGDDRTPHYEIDVVLNNEKVEMDINANNGSVKITEREKINAAKTNLEVEAQNAELKNQSAEQHGNTSYITQQQAIEIALAKAPGTVTSIEFDEEDNTMVYEIEIHNGKTEYDFEIHATTGAVLKYEEELIND